MMLKKTIIVFFILLISQARATEARDLAIIVNKANSTEELSLKELSRIFKQDRQYWDGEKIHILMREPDSWEREIILSKGYQMSDEQLKKFWLAKLFRGEVSNFPVVLGSVTKVKKLINNMPGAISFVDSAETDESIKVLKIEGRLPGEGDYPLRAE